MSRKIKRFILDLLTFGLILDGFTETQSKKWLRGMLRGFRKRNGISLSRKIWAYRHGFSPEFAEKFQITKSNKDEFISQRAYKYIYPINEKYSKWINDKITIRNIFKPFSKYLPACYYQLQPREAETLIMPLNDCPEGFGSELEDIFRLIQEKGEVLLTGSSSHRSFILRYLDGEYYINNRVREKEVIERLLLNPKVCRDRVRLITEVIEADSKFVFDPEYRPAELKLYMMNQEGDNPQIGDAFLYDWSRAKTDESAWIPVNQETGVHELGVIPFYEEIKEQVRQVCLFVPQIEFMGITVVLTKEGFKFQWFSPAPTYPKDRSFSPEVTAFLRSRVEKKYRLYQGFGTKCNRTFSKLHLRTRRWFARKFFPKNLFPYLSTRWISEVWNDFWTNKDASVKDKIWAYRHGFLSYRLRQYGITRENHLNYISDFEYKWLRHINGRHKLWFEDKITIKYVLSEFKECFPDYYYYITVKNGKNKIIPMMDCPEGFGADFEGILKLAREKKVLALKPDEGSHGEGFYKLSYRDGKYYLNAEEASEERIFSLLSDVDNQYLITEYIQMHPMLKKIYPGSVNTLRLTVHKKDGKTPYIGNGYLRFGSSRTGGVDNIGAGGIGAELDVETGRFFNARQMEKGAILVPCPVHPDTGEKLEGYLPNWDKVRALILEIAEAVPQIEYFGFDLALTEDGIKFPEINRFPDFPRIDTVSPETMDYLLYKLETRKVRYGYIEKMPFRLFNLPRRD